MSSPEQKLAELNKEAALLQKLMARFPDLQIHHGRFNNKRYYSKLVNPIADKIHYKHSCGCCADAVYYADPYIDFEGTAVYTDPVDFQIGCKSDYDDCGYRFNMDWEERYVRYGINPMIIEQIRKYIGNDDEVIEEETNVELEPDFVPSPEAKKYAGWLLNMNKPEES